MLHAELHGKLAPEADDAERREDVLTSTVFGLLFATGAWGVAINWLKYARPIGHEVPLDVALSDRQLYWFWPRLDNAEPDLVIQAGQFLVIIEAKYHSGKSCKDSSAAANRSGEREDVKDQLVREWRACSPQAAVWTYPGALRDAIGCCERVLVYLVQRRRLARERRAVEQSLAQAPGARMYILTWEDLDEVLAAKVGALWAVELRSYLHRKRLTAFRGFHGAIGSASTSSRLRAWAYAPAKAEADLRGAFTSEALPALRGLAAWRGSQAHEPSTSGWVRIAHPAAIARLAQLAIRPSQLESAGAP